jgi:hypothetical protein
MSTTKKYRVIYNNYSITAVMEDGEFNTASGDNIIADTKDNIITMLTALGIDCSMMENYD